MEFYEPAGEDEVMRYNEELAQKREYTVEDIRNLSEDVRAELIDGQIYYFAAPKMIHQRIAAMLLTRLQHHIEEKHGDCQAYTAPADVCLDCDDRTMVEPDVMVICDRDKIHEDACYGAPDLIIEIASKSTRKRDYGIKMVKYRNAGVKEYWIIDPERRTVLICWFEDESINCLYSFDDEISFRLFPEVAVRIGDWI